MFDLILRNATVVNHDGRRMADIAVCDGKIVRVEPEIGEKAAREVDVKGKMVFPGMIDPHVHIGSPDWNYADDLAASTQAAAVGGMTTLIDFLADVTTIESQYNERTALFPERAFVDVAYHAGIYTEGHIAEMERCAELGMPSYKLYLPFRAEDSPAEWVLDDEKLTRIMTKIAAMGGNALATFHAENIYIDGWDSEGYLQQNPDANWNQMRPNLCESSDLARMGELSRKTGCPIYMVHMSAGDSAELMESLQKEGLCVPGETCAHYLTLAASQCDRELTKVNPPIREQADIDRLWKAINDGVIGALGSDHYSTDVRHKQPFTEGLPGFAGVQTTLPILLSEGVAKGRITPEKLAEIGSYGPAKLFGLYPQKGEIAPGFDADLVVVDMERQATIRAEELLHICNYTPFEGMEVTGLPVMTFLRGQLVAENGKIVAQKAGGKYLHRSL